MVIRNTRACHESARCLNFDKAAQMGLSPFCCCPAAKNATHKKLLAASAKGFVMKPEMSKRTQGVTYAIRDILQVASKLEKKGAKLIKLNIGDPIKFGYKPPEVMLDSLRDNAHQGYDFYSDSRGLLELREAIAFKENKFNSAGISADDVLVTTGVSEAINFLYAALTNVGERILIPDVQYPSFKSIGDFYQTDVAQYRTTVEEEWLPDLDHMRSQINEKTKFILVNTPNNPTGAVYPSSTVKAIIDLAGEHDLPIIADETYDQLTFDGHKHTGFASMSKDVPIFGMNGFSKVFLAPGWRIGYTFLHDPEGKMENVWEGVARISRVRLCSSTPLQKACATAASQELVHLPAFLESLKERRDITYKGLSEIPEISVMNPKATFYIFPKIDLSGLDLKNDEDFVIKLLHEKHVLAVYGSGFGLGGHSHMRLVFMATKEELHTALERIAEFVKEHRK